MTASPMSIRAGPFVDGIVEYSHQYNMEDSVVLIVHNEGQIKSEFHMITNIDRLFIYLFVLSFFVVLSLFLITMDKVFVTQNWKLFFNLILPIFNQGIIVIDVLYH